VAPTDLNISNQLLSMEFFFLFKPLLFPSFNRIFLLCASGKKIYEMNYYKKVKSGKEVLLDLFIFLENRKKERWTRVISIMLYC